MDLILWRHAEAVAAESNLPDNKRRLTKQGEKQAQEMAKWLKPRLPKNLKIFVSPTERTQQTALMLGLPFDIDPRIGIGRDAAELIAASDWPTHSGAVLLVGHQPSLGRLASLLIGGTEADWTIKKGAVWWISKRTREGREQNLLRAVINPEMLR